jgi:hypothetical protein
MRVARGRRETGAAVLHDLGDGARRRTHARQLVGHGLEERDAEALVERRHDEGRGVAEQRVEPVGALRRVTEDGAEPAHAAGVFARGRSDDRELGLRVRRAQRRERGEQLRAALALELAPKEQQPRLGELARKRRQRESVEVRTRPYRDDLVGILPVVLDERPARPVGHRHDQVHPVIDAPLVGMGARDPV